MQLTKSEERRIQNFIRARVRTDQDAEDIYQETLLQAFKSADNFRGEAEYSTWVCGIALNLVRNHICKNAPKDCVCLDDVCIDNHSDDGGLEAWEHRQTLEKIETEAKELPECFRIVLACLALEMSIEEGAQELGVPVGTFKSRTYRLREKLEKLRC